MQGEPTAARELDFDLALERTPAPPLAEPDGSFELIRSRTAFTRMEDGCGAWLLEAHRLLTDDGLLVVDLSPRSEWWVRAPWWRSFELVSIEEDGGRRAVLRKRTARRLTGDLERAEPGEQPEPDVALANAVLLRAQLDLLEERQRRELERDREEFGRELMRRSFDAADREWSRGGPGSPAALVAAEYEATTSWKLTRPLRALGAMLRRVR